MTRAAIVTRPIEPSAVIAEVASTANGATSIFVGTVRDVNDGRAVTGIEYTAYEPMAGRELAKIAAEAARKFGDAEIVVEHRVGTLALGDVSIAIAAAHPHRRHALDATRFVIEEIKRLAPIWKCEHYADGTREWVDPSSSIAPTARSAASLARNVTP
jgi:molybdopterin synthase catalytic subunit